MFMRNRYFLTLNLLFVSVIIFVISAGASFLKSQEIIDSKGKDFWITFLPNYHNNQYNPDDRLRFGDSLYIFITCDKPTNGTIEYYDRNNVKYTDNFSITDPAQMYIFKVSHYNFEPLGWNASGQFLSTNNCEKVTNLSFHVTSRDDITVYAHSQAKTTSDAFLVFPTDVLGTEYIVVSYNSDGSSDGFNSLNPSSTPSQFAIVSAEDDNEITINPVAPTRYNALNEQKIRLNKGQVYLVQADITIQNLRTDLTGSKVKSTKPFALFCGHQRSTVPVAYSGTLTSRDILIEQIPPMVTWGQNSFLVPYVQSEGASPIGKDLYRIISASDGNEIKLNNQFLVKLDKGQFYEGSLTTGALVTASSPIMVAQYKKTSSDGPNQFLNSDPFLMIMSPKEQFLKYYRIINVQAYEFDEGFEEYYKVYTEQYITVVVPDNAINSLKVDGALVNQGIFSYIVNSGYSFGHIQVSDGVHEVKCDREFGIYIYGYGNANSYGYTGGMSFKPLDPAPLISSVDTCFGVKGTITDSSLYDSGLAEVQAPEELRDNVNITISNFQKFEGIAYFEAILKNKYKDGSFKISVSDSSGNVTTKDFKIPGFTICHPNAINVDTLPYYKPDIEVGKEYCFKIPVTNYGNFDQLIKSLRIKRTDVITIKYGTPKNLIKGNTDSIEICILIKDNSIFADTLYLEGQCGSRPIAAVYINKSDCDETMVDYIDFRDDNFLKYKGFAKKIIDRIRLTPSRGNANGSFWRTLKFPVKNGFVTEFAFAISDGVNHTGSDNSLPGADGIAFVIQNNSPDALGAFGGGIGYEEIPNSVAIEIDLFRNDSTQLFDYFDPNGNHLAVMSMGKEPNTAKHTKQATLGITDTITEVKPNGMPYYVRIEYNQEPDRLSIYMNKKKEFGKPVLIINNFKLDKLIDLENGEWAFAGFTSATANSYENHDILSWYFCPKHTNSQQVHVEDNNQLDSDGLRVFPNPFDSDINIQFSLEQTSQVELAIYNLLGEKIAVIYNSITEPGLHRTRFETKDLPAGLYICSVNIAGKIIKRNIIRIAK
jgi:hypothetical protein